MSQLPLPPLNPPRTFGALLVRAQRRFEAGQRALQLAAAWRAQSGASLALSAAAPAAKVTATTSAATSAATPATTPTFTSVFSPRLRQVWPASRRQEVQRPADHHVVHVLGPEIELADTRQQFLLQLRRFQLA